MSTTEDATHAHLRPGPARGPEAGTVSSDEHLASGSGMPHGGVKGSGFGKDMSMYAREER